MKKILLFSLLGITGLINAKGNNKEFQASKINSTVVDDFFKKIKIDEWVTDTSGVSWHIYGTVDISIGFSGVSINHYDIHMVGPKHYHFQGKISREQSEDNIKNTIDGSLTNEETGETVNISSDIKILLYQLNENVIKNN